MTFAEIYNMLLKGSYGYVTNNNTIMECATRIYIKQMEIDANKENKKNEQVRL